MTRNLFLTWTLSLLCSQAMAQTSSQNYIVERKLLERRNDGNDTYYKKDHLNNNVRKVLPSLKFEYVVDETERAKSKYPIPDIEFVCHEKDVKYIYEPGNKGDGPV